MSDVVRSRYFHDVGQFHDKFGIPNVSPNYYNGPPGPAPHLMTPDVFQYRVNFLKEELNEIIEAHNAGDIAATAREIVDLIYVAVGTAHLMHIPLDDVWDEVQRANMQRERAKSSGDTRSKRNHSLDIVKPVGWQPPDVERVIRERIELCSGQSDAA